MCGGRYYNGHLRYSIGTIEVQGPLLYWDAAGIALSTVDEYHLACGRSILGVRGCVLFTVQRVE